MNKIKYPAIFYALLCSFFSFPLIGQEYFGAGNDNVIVFASGSNGNSMPSNTVNGSGMNARLMEASRFLSQATFGADYSEIEELSSLDFETWIDRQINLPLNELELAVWENWDDYLNVYRSSFDNYLVEYIEGRCYLYETDETGTVEEPEELTQQEVDELREFYNEDIFGPTALFFNYAWSDNAVTGEDQLRQRMAYALSQILVISSQSTLGDHAESLAAYYDILQRNAFGNFRDILMEITLSPAMAFYLSHLNNPKAIPEENIHPDENYAREIMQLFTIGLYELNLDGTRKQNSAGFDIPTYNNDDIKELARVFTGLGPGSVDPNMDFDYPYTAEFGTGLYVMNKTEPLVMYEDWHDNGSKSALNGLDIPAGQSGMEDIEMTVDYLFNHPNVGPFICKQLIQRFITSNPSDGYVERVSTVFNNNGQGERGDMGAVIKAILLDEEARSCEALQDPLHGKLNEPFLRAMKFIKSIPHFGRRMVIEYQFNSYGCGGIDTTVYEEEILTSDLRYWNNGYNGYEDYKQYPLMAPSVFNFYLPDHQPVGEMTELGLVAPEFKIHDSSSAINYMNHMWMFSNPWYNILWYNWHANLGVESVMPDFEELADIYSKSPEDLINHLDIVYTKGQLSDHTRNVMRDFVEDSPSWPEDLQMARTLLYLLLISPDYTIDK